MPSSIATVLVPSLFCSPRVFAGQLPALWQCGPVMVADHRRDDTIEAIARRVLDQAPAEFALGGISMGGYVAFEILRQAPQRVRKLMLLSTSARPDTPEQTERRWTQIKMAENRRFDAIADLAFPTLVHPKHHGDEALRQVIREMAQETGPEAYVKQQKAILARIDSRPSLKDISCPTLVLSAQDDALIPGEASEELARGIAGAQWISVPECGHLSTLEQATRIAKAMTDFVSK